jgi:hypothetical protein
MAAGSFPDRWFKSNSPILSCFPLFLIRNFSASVRFRFAGLFAPAAVCAWCKGTPRVLRRGGWLRDRSKISHGICTGCQLAFRAARERV